MGGRGGKLRDTVLQKITALGSESTSDKVQFKLLTFFGDQPPPPTHIHGASKSPYSI